MHRLRARGRSNGIVCECTNTEDDNDDDGNDDDGNDDDGNDDDDGSLVSNMAAGMVWRSGGCGEGDDDVEGDVGDER